MTGLEALNKFVNIFAEYCVKTQHQEMNATNMQTAVEYLARSEEARTIEKELKALEILKRNVKVSIDYGVEKRDISFAFVFYIDNKETIYVVDEAIKEQSPEHFKELELLKEVLEC